MVKIPNAEYAALVSRRDALAVQLTSALAALRDLEAGYPWRELHINLPQMLADAAQLGVTLED